jgi:hypothetical protein
LCSARSRAAPWRGRTGGRPPKPTDDDIAAAKAMLANPDIGVTQIAHRLGVSPATFEGSGFAMEEKHAGAETVRRSEHVGRRFVSGRETA